MHSTLHHYFKKYIWIEMNIILNSTIKFLMYNILKLCLYESISKLCMMMQYFNLFEYKC